MNLPAETHSHGLRRLCAIESERSGGSFDDAHDAVKRSTGQRVGKRQLEQLARSSARDFESFYASRRRDTCEPGDVIVLSCDGKGVVMRPEALREQTRRQAQNSQHKLQTRLSSGEKRGSKRIAEVAAVYEVEPVPRTSADIMPATDAEREAQIPSPVTKRKWLNASVEKTPRQSSLACSTRLSAATPPTNGRGSPWSTATATRSTGSPPKRARVR